MMLTTSAAATRAAHAEYGWPHVRAALHKAGDYAMAMLYRYIRHRIELECGGPARLVSRRQPWPVE